MLSWVENENTQASSEKCYRFMIQNLEFKQMVISLDTDQVLHFLDLIWIHTMKKVTSSYC